MSLKLPALEPLTVPARTVDVGAVLGTVVYRVASASNADAIARLHAESWRRTYRGILSDAFLDAGVLQEREAVWSARLRDPPESQLVIVAAAGDDEVLGFACAYEHDDDARFGSFIDNLHVDLACQRQGIGTELLRRAAQWAAERRPRQGVFLWVLDGNTRAQRFYEHLGASMHGAIIRELPGKGFAKHLRYAWPDAASLVLACASQRRIAAGDEAR